MSEDQDPQEFTVEDVDEFWTAILRSSIAAVLVIMVAKVVMTVAYGFWSGFEIEMNRVYGVIPQFVFGFGLDRFQHMVRVSWFLSSVGGIVWWIVTALNRRRDRAHIEQLRGEETETELEAEDLRYRLFVADAQRIGGTVGTWIGSVSLLMILGFEYLRKWLVDDVTMPAFPVWAFLVALVPVACLGWELSRRRRWPVLAATDISRLLDDASFAVAA